jgi:gluconate 2-dehydrogenase gamma chain
VTTSPDDRPATPSRRHFLIGGVAATALAADGAVPAGAQAPSSSPKPAPAAQQSQAPQPAPGPQGYRLLNGNEVETLTAMVARLIPADNLGPGAVELGVVTFIDRELGGQYGVAARWYMQGPWLEGTPSQGWQFALTPAQIYRASFLALDRWCQGSKGKRFADLAATDQDEVLTLLEGGKVDLEGIPSATFFQLLWQNTVEGYLSDPLYGGNRDMAAWRMISFPGSNPVLTPMVDLSGKLADVDPISIGS